VDVEVEFFIVKPSGTGYNILGTVVERGMCIARERLGWKRDRRQWKIPRREACMASNAISVSLVSLQHAIEVHVPASV
jgi:hypothetical protein